MAKTRDAIAPEKRATLETLKYLAAQGVVFRRCVDDGAVFTKKGEEPFDLQKAQEFLDIDGYQVFKGDLRPANMLVVDIDKPDDPLGQQLIREFQASGTYGCRSASVGYHFYLKGGEWLKSFRGAPAIKNEEGKVVAEFKRDWITLYKPHTADMPFVEAADERVATWRELVGEAKKASPSSAGPVDVSDIEAAMEKWEERVRALPEGQHNSGMMDIILEIKRSLWAKNRRDLALLAALQIQKVYDKEVSPGDDSYSPERLRSFWLPPRHAEKDDDEAQPKSRKQTKEEKEEEDREKPDLLNIAFQEYMRWTFGGFKGLLLIVKSEGKKDVKKALGWDKTLKRWTERPFTCLKNSIIQAALIGYMNWLEREGLQPPKLAQRESIRRVLHNELMYQCGATEEELAEFDRPSNKRFLFGSYGVCEVVCTNPDAPADQQRFELRTGGENKPEYKLKRDIHGHIATDEEYERDLPKLLHELNKYAPAFKTDDPASPNGNWWIDDLQLLMSTSIIDVALRPIGICWGTGNNGKSKMWHYFCKAFGPDFARGDLNEATFTDGTGSVTTGPRVLGHRARLNGPALVVVPESPLKAALDSGFIKSFCDRDEAVNIGGMYKEGIDIVLECPAFISLNSVPIIHDQKFGMSRRIWLFPFKHIFPKRQKSSASMDAIFMPLLATMRRWLFEGGKRLVTVHHCSLPEQHPSVQSYRDEFDEGSQSDIKSELKKCFRKVEEKGKEEKDTIDWFYQKRRARQGFVGGKCEENRGVALGGMHSDTYHGIMLAVQAIIHAKDIRQKSYSSKVVKDILQELGFEFYNSYITNIVHTDYLVSMITEAFGEGRVAPIIRAMYRHYEGGASVAPFSIEHDKQLPQAAPSQDPLGEEEYEV